MRNAEATRERILKAALAEFLPTALPAPAVDRIAQAAKCNKNLIYIYFEDKEALFTTVLIKHLMRVHEEQPFTPDDLPGYAAKLFDWAIANPDLMRLLAWCTLGGETERISRSQSRFSREDQPTGGGTTSRRRGPCLSGGVPAHGGDEPQHGLVRGEPVWAVARSELVEHPAKLRKSVIEAVRLLTNAGKQSRTTKTIKSR